VIEARGLTKRFGGRTAIDDVSFDVAAGETVGFLGPNGAGKTTTIRILAGIFPPSAGTVRIDGRELAQDPLRARARIGYLQERPALYGEMTVAALLGFVAALRGVPSGAARVRAVERAVERARLRTFEGQRIESLSKGTRQRVGLAAALVGDPSVLLLDEPTAGLDPAERSEARALIRALAPQRAVLLSSHLLEDVQAVCDRVVVLHRGRVVAADRPAALAARLAARTAVEVEARAPAGELAQVLERVPGVRSVAVEPADTGVARCRVVPEPSRDVRAELAAAVVARGWDLLGLTLLAPSLEAVFLDLVEHGDPPP
jgi:ABC-2 type transport system ATP-binding protein